MELEDLDGEIGWLYRLAGADERDPPGLLALANGLKITLAWGSTGSIAARFDRDRHMILVRPKVSLVTRSFWIAHEICEYWLERIGVQQEDREQLCDAMAARLLAPRPSFQEALRIVGADFEQLGEIYTLSQTCTALRLGEVEDRPVAVVMPSRVVARGTHWTWGSDKEMRALAVSGPLPGGLQRVRLTDNRRRVALVGE